MMYDRSDVGVIMRKHVYVNLALWHTYKHACMKLWSMYSQYLMAGLFHCFFPSGIFLKKPSFTLVATLLTIIRLAYPRFRDQLNAAIAAADDMGPSFILLSNIKALCCTFIPMVHYMTLRCMDLYVYILGRSRTMG